MYVEMKRNYKSVHLGAKPLRETESKTKPNPQISCKVWLLHIFVCLFVACVFCLLHVFFVCFICLFVCFLVMLICLFVAYVRLLHMFFLVQCGAFDGEALWWTKSQTKPQIILKEEKPQRLVLLHQPVVGVTKSYLLHMTHCELACTNHSRSISKISTACRIIDTWIGLHG